jgi:hypothetical protein
MVLMIKQKDMFVARKERLDVSPKDMLAVHNLLDDDVFPSLKEIIQVVLTIPVKGPLVHCASRTPSCIRQRVRKGLQVLQPCPLRVKCLGH